MRHDEMNPIKTAKQYGMVAAILSGRSKTISQQLAEEMMNKTLQHSRSKFARELARRRKKGNPHDEDMEQAMQVSSEWHGRKPKEILDVEETTTYNDTGVMLGTLEELGVLGVDSEGEFTQWTISFKKDRPILSSDLEQQNLEFVGGDQRLPLDSKYTTGKNEVTLGYCYCIVYETDKHHLEGSNGYAESYEHFFAEEYYKKLGYDVGQYPTSDDYFEEMLEEGIVERAVRDDRLPMLVYDCQNCKLRLVGGKYEIKDVGIVD